ncbi:MAG TPA: ABC transporter ATP-binding protein [Longimicrobiales bacterium]
MAEERKRPPLSSVWREARELAWRYRRHLSIGFVLMLVNRLAGMVLPLAPKYLIDEVINGGRLELLWPLGLAVGGATVLQAATSFSLSQVVSIAGQRAIAEMRKDVQARVLRLPLGYFDSTQTGMLITRVMRDAEGIRNLVGTGIIQLAGGLVTAAFALAILFYWNWSLTLVVIVILGAFAGMMAFAFRKLRPIFRERNRLEGEVTGRLTQSLGGIRVVKVYTAEPRERRVFARGVHRLLRNIASTITGTSAVGAGSTIIVGLVGVIVLVGGGRAVVAGTMTPGEFFSYVLFIGMVAAPLIQVASIGTQITEAFAGLDRIRELRKMATEDEDDGRSETLPEVHGDVVFEDVHFAYEPGEPVLNGISFHAPAGSTTALVGSSGSGKSTTIGLVMAFHRPTSGRVRVDGKDLATLQLRDYRSKLGVVLQDNFLFDGTITENIRFARPGATDAEVREAARIAHCDEFVERFEKGYDTVVGERGVKLSGGQRQRVAIARAILADPRILILDEATSSLDSESEAMIQDGLRTLRSGRTTFVIAHRLSTIQNADQILVLEGGRIVERGTHAELLALGGRYRELYEKQHRIETDRFINPGEDFTPEPERPVAPPAEAGSGRAGAL